jgi:tRNA(Ile2)-agmatinylcytidine synthase
MTTSFSGQAALAIPVPATMLAFDDTDSPDGMCTTYLSTLVLEELPDLDLLGWPRLVRLNPNVPWKTRGNAAVCLPLGVGEGRGSLCGRLERGEVRWHKRGRPVDPGELLERASKVVARHARFECHTTNPGLVASVGRPSASLYWRAVRGVVRLEDVEAELSSAGASWRRFKSGRGVIGASAAMAWRPRDRTWEVITYRPPDRFGTPRDISVQSVVEMDRGTRSTFNNYDPENGHVAIAPGSPCPVLFGIRGDSPSELLRAKDMIRGERPAKWLMYMSNQGTEDHIVRRRVRGLAPGDSAKVRATVVAEPSTVPGGHVIVRIGDGAEVDAAFYEQSRGMRDAARELMPGDEIVAYGSVRSSPRSLNVEKLQVVKLLPRARKVANPTCGDCGKRMGSMGSAKGFRCKVCGARAPPESAAFEPVRREVRVGWYEPPVSSRRHLHKPLRRMPRGTFNKI